MCWWLLCWCLLLLGWLWSDRRCLSCCWLHLHIASALAFENELPRATQGCGNGLLQQAGAALHHPHPVARNLHHGAAVIQSHQLGLLGEQHSGGGQFKAAEDLLPQLRQIGAHSCRWGDLWQLRFRRRCGC